MMQKKAKQAPQIQAPSASQGPPQPPQIQRIDSTSSSSSNVVSGMLPSTKTQAQPTPMPSLSPVLAHSPAQSAGASPQPTSAKILQSQSSVLAQNTNWLAQASERIEKTIELINIKKIKEALQILLEINQVFESSGVCVSTTASGIDSTKSTSPIPGSKPADLSGRRNKTSVQLAIITKYNLACCFQSLGESQKCIKYLQQASRQLSYYSNMDKPEGLFKVNRQTDKSSTKKGGGVITPGDNSGHDSGVDFNEYNCVGATSSHNGLDNESQDQQRQTHDQLSAQLQANRYLCKFHLQLCAIMSQLGQHIQANENGQQAAAIAEVILIKTHEFCQMSVEELFQRDSKFKSIVDQAADPLDNTLRDDYQGTSLKSSMQQNKSVRKLTRGSSVTSLYSQEKERKSVSIRRSRSKANTMRGRDSSMGATSDDTTQSLERMYTFNLCRVQKQASGAKAKPGKKESAPGVPSGEDVIDIRPIDMQAKNDKAGQDTTKAETASATSSATGTQNPEEENKNGQDRTTSQASRSMPRTSANSFCPTYQVLERTNIQEKQILNVQPLLNEFRSVSEEFNQQNLTLAEAETHHKNAQFASLREIQTLKANKRYKINVRNTLGVKDHNNWIYNLNIGNVMNLTPMNSDELNTQSDVFQELSKDTMLEKIILYVVAYFCVGTEIRFQATKMEKKESAQEYIKVWSSEMWHGKSLQVACMFLPEDCPLVDHIIKSYKKHYIGKQSLLSVVVQPRPRVQAPTQPIRSQATSETKPMYPNKVDRPTSQQQVSSPINELTQEQHKHKQTLKGGDTESGPRNHKDRSSNQNNEIGEHLNNERKNGRSSYQPSNSSNVHGNQSDKIAWQHINYNKDDDESANHGSKVAIKTKSAGVSKQMMAQGGNQTAGKSQNSKHRQKTLKDMVFQNMKPSGQPQADMTKHMGQDQASQQQQQRDSNSLMQYNKVPPKSPESPEGSEPNGENQEAIVIFSKGVARQRKLSRNKQSASATAVGQDGAEDGGEGTNQELKESDSQQEPSNKANGAELNQSPSVRRRAVQPINSQQRAASPRPEPQKGIQLTLIQQEQKTEPVKKSRPYAQTITYNDIQRLQQNLNIQIQQNKQKQFKQGVQNGKELGLPESENLLAIGERPQSAQQTSSAEAAPQMSGGSYQKRIEALASGNNGNNNSGSTPKRQSQVSTSHKRYQQQPSITSSLQKLVSKPGSKGQSKVLQSEALNPQAWPTVASSASSKQGKQKIIMLQKQKKQMMGQGNQGSTALWLANNPASDKLQSKQPIQIGSTKFVDTQLKMLSGNSNTSTARGNKKHAIGLSPKHANEGSKKDNIIDNLRKKPIGDLQRAYDTAPGNGGQGTLSGLSKSIAKEKFHQSNLIAHQPVPTQHKMQMHVFSNKLGVTSQGGFTQSHTLKKSASTRQVVNLLDLQQIQQPHMYSNSKQLGGAQASQGLLSKHVGGHPHVGLVSQHKPQSSHGGSTLTGSSKLGAQNVQPGSYKTLQKKHKNTKSTGLLHHHM